MGLGLLNVHRNRIPHYSERAAPLTALTAAGANVARLWTPAHTDAFNSLRESLLAAPDLWLFDPSRPIRLFTDASDVGYGAALYNEMEDGELRPVAFYSKRKEREFWSAGDMEYGAFHAACHHFRHLLLGRHVFWHSDHKNLSHADICVSTRIPRMADALGAFDFTFVYVPGELNIVADALSRLLPRHRDLRMVFSVRATLATESNGAFTCVSAKLGEDAPGYFFHGADEPHRVFAVTRRAARATAGAVVTAAGGAGAAPAALSESAPVTAASDTDAAVEPLSAADATPAAEAPKALQLPHPLTSGTVFAGIGVLSLEPSF